MPLPLPQHDLSMLKKRGGRQAHSA